MVVAIRTFIRSVTLVLGPGWPEAYLMHSMADLSLQQTLESSTQCPFGKLP